MIQTLQVIQHQVEKIINHTDDWSLFGNAKDNTMTKALIQCQLGTLMSYITDRIAEFNWKRIGTRLMHTRLTGILAMEPMLIIARLPSTSAYI